VVDAVVRGFFAYRLWKLSRRNVLLTLSTITITAAILLTSIGLCVFCFLKIHDVFDAEHYSWVVYLELCLVCFGDIWLAIWLSYYLKNNRKLSRVREETSMLNTLLVYTVNTGSFCSVLSVVCLISYATLPDTYFDFAFLFPFTTLYANAMFATLNVRNWSHAGIDDARVPIMTVNGDPTIPVAFADAPPSVRALFCPCTVTLRLVHRTHL